LDNEELHNLYSSPNISYYQDTEIKKCEAGWICSTHGTDDKMHEYEILIKENRKGSTTLRT
jgi:hypothetical protein